MNQKFENIISRWLKCEQTGDGTMSEIIKILDEEGKNKNEAADVYIKE